MALKRIDDLTDLERIRLYPEFLVERYLAGDDTSEHIKTVLDEEFLTTTDNPVMVKRRGELLAAENRRLPLQSQFLAWAESRI